MNRRRITRQNSNVLNLLTKDQIVRLREAFNLIDLDNDSKISLDDLVSFMDNMGFSYEEEDLVEMISEISPNCNFMLLLTKLSEMLSTISGDDEMNSNFRYFEDKDKRIETSKFKEWMTEHGNPISQVDFEYLVRGCSEGEYINTEKLKHKIRHGEIE